MDCYKMQKASEECKKMLAGRGTPVRRGRGGRRESRQAEREAVVEEEEESRATFVLA